MKEFDPEELRLYSGKDGAPVYISLEGKVYDVSGSDLWNTGTHMATHYAGHELDDEFGAAPHGIEVLERVTQVGVLRKAPLPVKVGGFTLLERYPFLKRHPHPLMVHFPIALLIAAFIFETVFALTGCSPFRTSSLHCLTLGSLFLPFAITTGYLTWRINYMARPMKPVRIKIALSWMLLAVALATVWQMWAGAGAGRVQAAPVFLISLLIMVVLVSVTGYLGGQLMIPVERAKK